MLTVLGGLAEFERELIVHAQARAERGRGLVASNSAVPRSSRPISAKRHFSGLLRARRRPISRVATLWMRPPLDGCALFHPYRPQRECSPSAALSRQQASAPRETQRRLKKIRKLLPPVRNPRLLYLAPMSAFTSCGHSAANAYRRLVPQPDVSRCSKIS